MLPPHPRESRVQACPNQSPSRPCPPASSAGGTCGPHRRTTRAQEGGFDGERALLLGYLRNYRLTLELKCSGLDAEQLARRSVPPSNLSLLGLVRHLATVEQAWFRVAMAGEDVAAALPRRGRAGVRRRRRRPGGRRGGLGALARGGRLRGRVPRAAPPTWAPPVRRATCCARCCCTWSRSTRGTAATPTSCASASTAGSASRSRLPCGRLGAVFHIGVDLAWG